MKTAPSHLPLEEPSKERLRLWLRMLKSTRLIEATLRGKFRDDFNTTLPHFDVLAALSRFDDGLKMHQISGMLRVSNGSVTGIVDKLAESGMLVRVPVPGDRRATRVQLTRKGREEFKRQADAHEAWISELLADFSAEEARTLAGELNLTEPQMAGADG
ncbi:MAG: MarR family transcriptional regulator [Devosiaceae bacterium]|nr:MarR family transcriptional regulator [Devosiaceae bacterium MH13]